MQKWALKYLRCPHTGERLRLFNEESDGEEIKTGVLRSAQGFEYPIIDGVPRFLKGNFQDKESVSSFGFEWNELNFDLFYSNWKEHVVKRNFGGLGFFQDKLIVDCGAGSGMQSRWMLEAGAKKVISIELSDSIEIMQKNLTPFKEKILIVQADISNPPIAKESIEGVIYCINVLQHTKDPVKTLKALYALLAPGGSLYFTVYTKKDDKMYPREFLRKYVTTKISERLLLATCRIAGLFTFIPGLGYVLREQILWQGDVPRGKNYFKRKYRQVVQNTYDYYGSHSYQHSYTPSGLKSLFSQLGIEREKIKKADKYLKRIHKPGEAVVLIK